MKTIALVGLATVALSAALLVGRVAAAEESRTKESCSQLFHHLNTSGTGKLTLNEAAQDNAIAKTLDDPNLWRNGYVTEDEFTPLCMQGPKPQQ